MSLFRKKPLHDVLTQGSDDAHGGTGLARHLTVFDLTAFGIAAIIGAGSFSSLGEACFKGGPGVVLLFIICGIACAFTALCYAEFASRIPVAGSAYTYAYVSFGEVLAWIIGWALLMEYSIGNIYVAFSWSDYFTSLMHRLGWDIAPHFTCSYAEAHKAVLNNSSNVELLAAWNNAPTLAGLRIIIDLPALIINILITYLVYRGVKESRNFSNAMVILKLIVVVMVIIVGAFYIDTANWTPLIDASFDSAASAAGETSFMPKGFSGVMAAVSGVFFAYIGFDAVSVLAEESKNPQKDLPTGMIASLIICTVIYILLALVLTGVVDYKVFDGVGDPLAKIFEVKNVGWMQFLVAICAVVAMTSVLLVFQMGQPRIWMSMSRDGLLPPIFQKIHETYQTPSFSTILTGFVVGVPIIFTDKTFILDFTSIGTLFAFVLVCGGVLLIPRKEAQAGKFNLPHINGKYIYPLMVVGSLVIVSLLVENYWSKLFDLGSDNVTANISQMIFWLILLILSVFSFLKNWSLIPLLGLSTCLYLLTGMSASNWAWFFAWFGLGLLVYLSYGKKYSKLNVKRSK
ncbi:MAG: APC family permease [Bacteroidia bacterium]